MNMLVGIFSDAHGHLAAFDKALSLLRNAGCEEIWFLGDAVGYIPVIDVVRRLRELPDLHLIKGNHDAMLVNGSYAGPKDEVYQLSRVKKQADRTDLDFIDTLPLEVKSRPGGHKCHFVHGSPLDPTNGYVYPDTELAPFHSGEQDFVFMGHTHHPFVRKFGGTTFVNVGSCGLPRDEGRQGTCCIFDTLESEVTIERFPIGESATDLIEAHSLHPTVATYLSSYG